MAQALEICVLGAGTVGMSQALRILECQAQLGRPVKVTIIADKMQAETTSYGSGGLWEPYQILGTPDDKVNSWGRISFDHFLQLLHSPDAAAAGVQLLTAYNLLQEHDRPQEPSWRDIVFNFKHLTARDISQMGLPAKFTHGFSFATLVIEQKYYRAYLTAKLEGLGATFLRQRVENLDAFIAGPQGRAFDVVINCTGIGAGALLDMPGDVYPIRGQVLRVHAPWVNNVFFWGSSYIIPNVDSVVLGGTAQRDDWDTNPREADTAKILADVCDLFPAMKDARVVNVWAGLRPGRTPLRLDCEHRAGKLVIHNYGHGGSGITLAYGCADDVLRSLLIPNLASLDGSRDAASSEPIASVQGPLYSMREWVRYKSRL